MRALPFVAPFLMCAVAAAQTPQQPVFRSGVDLIEVDVSVMDERGRPVADLLAPEFVVTIDGRPRKVVSASFLSLRGSERVIGDRVESFVAPVSSNSEETRGRLIAIAVDRDNITAGSGHNAVRAASGFLGKLGPADRVAFVAVPQPGPLVDFTTNHDRVRHELERTSGRAQSLPGLSVSIGVYEALAFIRQGDPLVEQELFQRFCSQFGLDSRAYQACVANVTSDAMAIVQHVEQQTWHALQSLRSILDALRAIDGPKALVWISEGLVVDETSGELREIERLAGAANVTVHVILLDQPLIDMSERTMSPTSTRDRELEVHGLEMLAGYTRGALYRVSVGAEYAFARIEEELSAYYLLGVEALPSDSDGKRHSVKVSVRRRGTTVRSRREFVIVPEDLPGQSTPEDRIWRALRSPFGVTELSMRVATYTYQDAAGSDIHVAMASEIDGAGAGSGGVPVTLGYALIDGDGKIAASNVVTTRLDLIAGAEGPILEHVGVAAVEPGSYRLKLAAIDPGGRLGSVEHSVQAWQMAGVPFAVSDLVLADAPQAVSGPLRPRVEPRLSTDRLAGYLEIYADRPEAIADVQMRLEIARDESGVSLATALGALSPEGTGNRRMMRAVASVATLAPGRYLARAVLTRADQKIWEAARPFHVTAASAASASRTLIPTLLSPPAFDRNELLNADTIQQAMDLLARDRPGLARTAERIRKGQYEGAARQAFDAGDQTGALFLRGLELFVAGDLTRATTQLGEALRLEPDFAPAAVFLGGCYAATDRDREAVTSWRRVMVGRDRMPVALAMLADAHLRLGEAPQVIGLLRQPADAWPEDQRLRRRLGLAYAMTRQHAEALAAVGPYLDAHPDDPEALLVALQAIYSARIAGQPLLGEAEERARMEKYGRAYTAAKGPHEAVVATWVAAVLAPSEPH